MQSPVSLSSFWNRLSVAGIDMRLDHNITPRLTRGGTDASTRSGRALWMGTVSVNRQRAGDVQAVRGVVDALNARIPFLMRLPRSRDDAGTITAASGKAITIEGLTAGGTIGVGTILSYQTSGGVYMAHSVVFGGTRTVTDGVAVLELSSEVAPSGVVGRACTFTPVIAAYLDGDGRIPFDPARSAPWSFNFVQTLEAF